jgi:hypothetical protein
LAWAGLHFWRRIGLLRTDMQRVGMGFWHYDALGWPDLLWIAFLVLVYHFFLLFNTAFLWQSSLRR